jgi:tetratricopeptide (TPR) repeat protein
LGKYRDAYYHFKRARECAFTANDTENFVIAVIQAVKVLSDISRYKSCAKILAGLAKSLPSIRVSDKTKCLAYRWIARIYVLDSDYRLEALKFAQEALTIAQRMGKERYIGNCQFVIGEVNRRLGNQSSANNAYNKALKAARISGNKDLEVYSLLGIALLSAQAGGTVFSGNLAALRQSLEYQAPIENLYLDVLETLNTLRNDTSKDPTRLDYLISQLEASRKFGLARSLKEIKNLSNNGWDQSITAFNWNNFVL